MSASFHSDNWYRIENLQPALRPHVRVHRHRYRDTPWYVLQDSASERMLRISPNCARIVALMDGRRKVGEIWNLLVADTQQSPPNQDEVIDVLSRAHSMDMLQVDMPPEVGTLAKRRTKQANARLRGQILNPLSIKLRLWDPDRFLGKTLWLVRPIMGTIGLIVWALVVASASVVAMMHWSDLTHNVHDRLLSLGNLVAIALIYPVVKALHELGHGYAVKALGGEVHEVGVMLIYLMPVPYVDASAANAFADKWQRVAVSAAGIIVETFLASIALSVWLVVEPGILHSIAYNVMVICGISTVIFNGNPLMRFDGYFMLTDAIELPNLASRSSTFWLGLIQHSLYGVKVPANHPADFHERAWLFFYQLASVPYRLFISLSIAIWLAADYFFIGVAFAIGICWSTILKPLYKGLHYLVVDLRLNGKRSKASAVTLAIIAVLGCAIVLIPLPFRRTVEGVVWVPGDVQIRVKEDGFVERLLVMPGEVVDVGQPILVSSDPALTAKVAQSAARVRELEIDYRMNVYTDRVAAAITREALSAESVQLERLRERQSRLISRSQAAGVLSIAEGKDLEGRFARNGDMIGYVLNDRPRIVRAVVEQDTIDLVRGHLKSAQLRAVGRIDEVYPTRVIREVPAGLNDLPSASLGIGGGGEIAHDPQDEQGNKSLDRIFQFDFELNEKLNAMPIGARVYLRLNFEPETIFDSVYRRVRQLLLTRLNL